jgi:flagellar biosynthesis protein FlhA
LIDYKLAGNLAGMEAEGMKRNDLIVGLFILSAIMFFIIPMPSILLDLLLALNISIAMVVLFNSIYAKEVLSMAAFPTILLFTTIFRISLNVSSTKLILQTGEPGNVVETFGKFVGGNNLVIGLIIFVILIIIQFMVINKGSERIAEVTARFTLDAMPGKQMAIDADLNTGAITDAEAKERREKIQLESAFFGSMDGATKYVKGDAIAGLIITLINLVGGTVMGIMGGADAGAAFQQYAILTIGDGLVSQIPSLMISLATGILVTKASKEADFGDMLIKQLFSIPKVLYMVGTSMALLGLLTPLNNLVFISYGMIFIITGRVISSKLQVASIEEEVSSEETSANEIRKPENVVSLLQVDPIELEFGYGIIPLADTNQGGDLLDRVVLIRRQIALELGCVVPMIRLRDNIQLNPNQYIIKIKGIQVSEGEILFDHYMAMNPGYVEEEITGIPTFEPSFHLPAIWITEGQRERAEMLGYTVVDPPSIIATHLTEIIRSHIYELLTRQDVQNLVNNIQEQHQTLISELVPKLLNIGEIQKVLQNLLREGISIRDLVTIFETLADYAPTTRDTDVLTEYARQSLKRAISNKYFPSNEMTSVVTLDPKVEQEIMGSVKQSEQGAYLTLDPGVTKDIIESVQTEIHKLEDMGKNPIIITSPIVRMYFKRLTQDYFRDLIVVSYNEIDSNVELQSVGMVTV